MFTRVTKLGLLQKGVTPFGAWRTLGMGDFSNVIPIDVYSVAATVPINVDAYIPAGVLPQMAFFDPFNPLPQSGKTTLNYSMAPQL